MKEWTLIPPESGAIVIEGCSIFNHPRIRGRYRSSHLCRLSPALYPLLCRSGGNPERQETPWNASGIASPRFGHLSRFGTIKRSANLQSDSVTSRSSHAASRGVTHHQGSVQALPWSCLVPIHSVLTDDSDRSANLQIDRSMGTRTARIVHASFNVGGLGSRKTSKLSTAGRSLNFARPQFTGRPWLVTSGGVQNGWRALIFLDRPLNPLSINVQKKGGRFAQETQQKPAHNPLGFHGGSHG